MKRLTTIVWITCCLLLFCSSCKKNKPKKLENPLGLMLLGSDTSLPDGRYVIRTEYGCSGFANMLSCDNQDQVLTFNGIRSQLTPVDIIHETEIDTLAIWYVKKVRYISPDPDYALAFGYRIYQYGIPNGAKYRFLAFASTASTTQWPYDEIGDGGGKSATAGLLERDDYPRDPNAPTSLATSDDTIPAIDTKYLFQFYKSPDNPNLLIIKAGGQRATTGSPIISRWKFATAYWNADDCDGNTQRPHFRSESDKCETVDVSSGSSRRCYIGEFNFQKVY